VVMRISPVSVLQVAIREPLLASRNRVGSFVRHRGNSAQAGVANPPALRISLTRSL